MAASKTANDDFTDSDSLESHFQPCSTLEFENPSARNLMPKAFSETIRGGASEVSNLGDIRKDARIAFVTNMICLRLLAEPDISITYKSLIRKYGSDNFRAYHNQLLSSLLQSFKTRVRRPDSLEILDELDSSYSREYMSAQIEDHQTTSESSNSELKHFQSLHDRTHPSSLHGAQLPSIQSPVPFPEASLVPSERSDRKSSEQSASADDASPRNPSTVGAAYPPSFGLYSRMSEKRWICPYDDYSTDRIADYKRHLLVHRAAQLLQPSQRLKNPSSFGATLGTASGSRDSSVRWDRDSAHEEESLSQKDKDQATDDVGTEELCYIIQTSTDFEKFFAGAKNICYVPDTLSEALYTREALVVELCLRNPEIKLTVSEAETLEQLRLLEMCDRSIALALLQDKSKLPWICSNSSRGLPLDFNLSHVHVTHCAHQITTEKFLPFEKSLRRLFGTITISRLTDALRARIEELCGLGGIFPCTSDKTKWAGTATFMEEPCSSNISFNCSASPQAVPGLLRASLLDRVGYTLQNLLAAFALAQGNKICCDSFTALVQTRTSLQLQRIYFSDLQSISSILLAPGNLDSHLLNIASRRVLRKIDNGFCDSTTGNTMHLCALVVQFACVSFLSYCQAHIGPLDPFFIDTPQQQICLYGTEDLYETGRQFKIKASLVKLTCLGDMTRSEVLAFSSCDQVSNSLQGSTPPANIFDVQCTAEDMLDTWGPGYIVRDFREAPMIRAIFIGDGFVCKKSHDGDWFHWVKKSAADLSTFEAFELSSIMKIGAGASSSKCGTAETEAECRKTLSCALHPLDTHESFWEVKERQFGLGASYYFSATFVQNAEKRPGVTLKQVILVQPGWQVLHYLGQSWGLQVSLCTRLARRVTLRRLILDLCKMFVNPIEGKRWQKLVSWGFLNILKEGDLGEWLDLLELDDQKFILDLIYDILYQLRNTGFHTPTASLILAWPCKGDTHRGPRIPCENQTSWARVLADSTDCATFAYVTPECFGASNVACKGKSFSIWKNESEALLTELSPCRYDGSGLADSQECSEDAEPPILAHPQTLANDRSDTSNRHLRHGSVYFVKKLDTNIVLKAVQSSLPPHQAAGRTIVTVSQSSMKRKLSKIVMATMNEERKARSWVREKQTKEDSAETVLVRAE